MKKKRLLLWLVFGLLTALNVLIFVNRKRFDYRSYGTREELYAACTGDCVSKWRAYADDYPSGDQEQVSRLLDEKLRESNTTLQQIEELSAYLLEHFDDQRGVPSATLLSKTPLGQFNHLRLHPGEKLWCGNWSNIFAYFAWNRGITTRIVEIYKPGDHHVFNESYVPGLNAWVLVDLTNKIILPQDSAGKFLDGLSYAMQQASAGRKDDYYNRDYQWVYYHRYNLERIYAPGSRIRRYLSPDPWYEVLVTGKKKPGNFLFYVKLVALGLWIVFLFIVMMSLLFSRN